MHNLYKTVRLEPHSKRPGTSGVWFSVCQGKQHKATSKELSERRDMAFLQPMNSSSEMDFGNGSLATANMTSAPKVTSPGYTAREYIILITPVIVVLGTLFNALSVAVLLRPRFRYMSTSVYLIALAICDTIYLYTNSMTKNFIKVTWSFNYSTQFALGCSLYVYFLLTSRCIGAWLIVSVTLERLLVICLPIKAKIIATRKRALLATVSITVVILLANCYMLIVYEVSVDEKGKKGCDMQMYYVELGVDVAQKIIDMVIYSILPTVVLFVSNAVIIFKVAQSSNFRKDQAAGTGESGTGKAKDDSARRLTIMLLSVSTAFLVFTLPLASFLTHSTLNYVENFQIYYRSLYLLQLVNSAINFILYCASGPAFRRELFIMFGCSKNAQDTSSEASQQTQSKAVSEADKT